MRKERVFSLEEIASEREVVLVDASIFEARGDLPQEMYDCHDSLDIDEESLKEKIENASQLVNILRSRQNLVAIPEVIDEIRDYVDIINHQIEFHNKNIKSKKFRGKFSWACTKRKRRATTEKTFGYETVHDDEEIELDYLRIYSKRYFQIMHYLEQNVVDVNNENLLGQVKARTVSRSLKRDYKERYRDTIDRKKRIPRDTDERIVVKAYELASQGKDVAVVTNDSDIRRILNSCLEEDGLFVLPPNRKIVIYSDFEDIGYTVTFDSDKIRRR